MSRSTMDLPGDDLANRLRQDLREHAKRIEDDPQTNSVFSLAQSIFLGLEAADHGLDDIRGAIDSVHSGLLSTRIGNFRDQHGDAQAAWAPVRSALENVAQEGFEAFQAKVETPLGGIVFTAHPTFALSRPLRQAMAKAVTHGEGPALTEALLAESSSRVGALDLASEHDEAQEALRHAQEAVRHYARIIFETARKAFPDRWHTLKPSLVTVASWVGYDLDGRTDIEWHHSIVFRLREKAQQLAYYAERMRAIAGVDLEELASKLIRAGALADQQADLFDRNLDEVSALAEAANQLTTEHPDAIVSAQDILAPLQAAMDSAQDTALATELAILMREIDTHKLGTGRIHLRLNAAQIRTLIQRDLGLETRDVSLGRVALNELAEKARTATLRPVNFSDLFLEQSTARRQFMLCRQILTHIDADSPIRFLIAESENPATVMGALYLAKQYGVSHMLDISPLFETPQAMEAGGRFVERLLDQPEFVDYLKTRGHLSLQFGFSDSGRFVGQIAGDMAIERIHSLVGRALADKLPGIGLLLFNTHGESIGRGAYPGSFEERFDHLLTPWNRDSFNKASLAFQHEVSFQGGDGFLHFATEPLAQATTAAFCAHLIIPPDDVSDDAFYNSTDFVWDFYRALGAWQRRIFHTPDYGHLLNDFASSFLVKSGSRQTRRAGADAGPRGLRAIPHNAVLQQLGAPLNTACGIGSSVRAEADRLIEVINSSKRLRRLIMLAVAGRMRSSMPSLRGYAATTDPGIWVRFSKQADSETASAYLRVSRAYQDYESQTAILRIANMLSVDLAKFDQLLTQIEEAPSVVERHAERIDQHLLHALRQALMMRTLALVGRVPTVSTRHDIQIADLMEMATQMRIGDLVEALCRIFPRSSTHEDLSDALSEPGFGDGSHTLGYEKLHETIIGPLSDIQDCMHRITIAIAHAYGAYG